VWNAGRNGAPPPDEAKLVRGETNLYAATLGLMKLGAYSVEVNVEGRHGNGTLIVPVNAIATNTRMMPRWFGLLLSGLGLLLFTGAVKIVGAAFGESLLAPGEEFSTKAKWRGRRAMAIGFVCFTLLLFGGKKWWDFEEADYR